jgi:hypothetical protein
MRVLWFPKCVGCQEELFSAPTRGDVVACRCGVVSECLDWQARQFKILDDRRKRDGGGHGNGEPAR